MSADRYWQAVVWFTRDGIDVTNPPYCRSGIVEAVDEEAAYDAGFDAICRPVQDETDASLVNWYVRPATPEEIAVGEVLRPCIDNKVYPIEFQDVEEPDPVERRIWLSVGWFAANPLDPTTPPVPRRVIVEGGTQSMASERAYDDWLRQGLLDDLDELLNWYTKPVDEVPADQLEGVEVAARACHEVSRSAIAKGL
jgi:hypothetical protein